ncbi:Prominin-1-A, partial [Geodia barretti]
QAFNCTSLGVGSEDFLPFDGFTNEDIFPYLADVNESFTTIDFREFAEKINESEFLSFDLTQLEANLTLVVNASTVNTTVHERASQILDDLVYIQRTVQDLQRLRGHAEGNVSQLQIDIKTSEHEVVVFVDNLEQFITNLHDIVTEATDRYIDRLCGFVDDYIDYANDTIRNELGRCKVFPAAYDAVYSTVCENAVDGLNGYWLGVGWSMLFTLVGVVVGIVLSDYFRRAGTRVVRCNDTSSETASLVSHDDDDDDNDVSAISMRVKGKSYPSNARALPEEQ